MQKKGASARSDHIECLDERSQLLLAQLLEPLLDGRGGVPDLIEQLLPPRRNARDDMAPVIGIPLPADQLGLLESIEEPRNVGLAVDHPLTDFPPAESISASTA